MSKSRNARSRSNSQRRQPAKPKPPEKSRTIAATIADAAAELSPEQREAAVGEAPETLTAAGLRTTWENVQRLRSAAEERDSQAKRALEHAEQQTSALEHEREQQEEREQKLAGREQKLDADTRALADERELLSERELPLVQREQDLAQREQQLQDERAVHSEELERRRAAVERELEGLREEHRRELEHSEAEQVQLLEQRERELERARTSLERAQIEHETARDLLEEKRALFDEQLEQRVAARQEWFSSELAAHEQRLEQARADRERLETRLRELEESRQVIDGRPATDVAAELKALREQVRQLEEELLLRPPSDQAGRLGELARRNDALHDELASARRLHGDLEIELEQLRTDIGAKQLAEAEAAALKSTINGYRAALAEQKQHFDDLVARQQAQSPFARMAAMDDDVELQEEPLGLTHPSSIASFVKSVRARIAAEPLPSGERLYYAERDLRLFVAGLASSPLQILQGRSGTGKTSLPLALADSIGGGCAVVEVQAGWRDHQDLLGHYNTFEKRYDETRFVQALYRAQCPAYVDRPFFVVLDEMNLSYVEQYFADVLSAITRPERELTLTNVPLRSRPKLLGPENTLMIPPNVWFVGTANHDETTRDFADKTYDRAHVQELSARPEPFPHDERRPGLEPVSFPTLTKLFDEAAAEHADAALRARKYLEDELAKTLDDHFEVGWANRLNPQLNRFVPVVLAGGGTIDEAVDHILVTKILRKIRGRHDIQLDDLDVLEERIVDSWSKLGNLGEPSASLDVLEREKRRLSAGLG